jgi:nucleoside transporter
MIHSTSSHSAAAGDRPALEGANVHIRGAFARLSVMMLLEFIVFGSWFATLGLVLATNGLAAYIGPAYFLSAIAAIISPIVMGAVGDRYLASQKLLGLAHLAGAAVMLVLPSFVAARDGRTTVTLVFVYMLFFQPTLGLANTIALHHLRGKQNAFPYLRVFATFGWVLAGVAAGAMGLSASTGVFTFACVASVVLGLYAFTLPATPPSAKDAAFRLGDLVGAKSLVLFRDRSFSILMLCAFLTSISLGVYNAYASPYLGVLGISNVAGVLAIGQASEVVFIACVPFVLARLGMKWALLLGMAVWGLRFVLFILAADGNASLAIAGVAMHGLCNDLFMVLSAMYIDRITPPALKAQAQSWLVIAISGFGSAMGSLVSSAVFAHTVALQAPSDATAWTAIWMVPIGSALLTTILWTCWFRESRTARN